MVSVLFKNSVLSSPPWALAEMSVHWQNGLKQLCPVSVPAGVRNHLSLQDANTDGSTGDWVYIKSNFPEQEPVVQTNVQNSSKGNSCLCIRPPRKWVHMGKCM